MSTGAVMFVLNLAVRVDTREENRGLVFVHRKHFSSGSTGRAPFEVCLSWSDRLHTRDHA